MSYERPDPDRTPYTPPTDDHLPFDRSGFDARGGGGGRRPVPLTLVASAIVLLVLIAAVILFYRSGVRGANEAPPVLGEPVGELTGEAPAEAQPIDPEAGIDVYVGGEDGAPEFTPPPETPRERPAPLAPAQEPPPVKAEPTTPPASMPATPPKPEEPAPAPAAATGGSAAVQIGAFSSEAIADREYAAVAAAFPQFASGRTKRVEAVQTSNGQTVYRTTFQGFPADQARAFCAALRASGRDCLVR